jgi:LSD1 subclass zinc finger protein
MSDNLNTPETIQKEVVCKNCGGKLQYAPGTTHLKCPFCGTENEIAESHEIIEELDFEKFAEDFKNESETQETVTVKCQACGAQTTFNPNVVSEFCPCCGTPLVVKNATSSHTIKPKGILPFSIDQNKAMDDFRNWINKLWFAPNKLKKYASSQEKLTGLYIPYWSYNSETATDYTGERGDDYQTTETYTEVVNGESRTNTRTVTHTRWTYTAGHVDNSFHDVLVVASKSLPRKYVEQLEPWDLEHLVPYNDSYLSGFRTESYQENLKEGFDDAKIRMDGEIRSTVCSDIGGDHQRVSSMNTVYNDIKFKHLLLPVWISAYSYNDKIYRFMINGRTGEVQGERPYSWIKITLAIVAAIAVVAIIAVVLKK